MSIWITAGDHAFNMDRITWIDVDVKQKRVRVGMTQTEWFECHGAEAVEFLAKLRNYDSEAFGKFSYRLS